MHETRWGDLRKSNCIPTLLIDTDIGIGIGIVIEIGREQVHDLHVAAWV